MKEFINILGINFVDASFDDVVSEMVGRINQGKRTFLVTANPEIVMYSNGNPEYKQIIQSSDFTVPDGAGIILASRLMGTPLKERVAGFDLTMRLLELAGENQWSIYLLGGRKEVNDKAVQAIVSKHPGIHVAGNHHGYINLADEAVVNEIIALKPDIILVALGFPKQEQWISLHKDKFIKGIFIGVGGTIDVLAGDAKRAPYMWRKLNLEWFYRLIKQPSRWKRMLALPRFVIEVLKRKAL